MSQSTPKYILVEQYILEKIREGEFVPDQRLPGEDVLAVQTGVAKLTVRQALNRLTQRGVLVRRHRSGTYVQPPQARPRNVALLVFNAYSRHDTGLLQQEIPAFEEAAARAGRSCRVMLMTNPLPSVSTLAEELTAMKIGAVGLLGFLNTDADFIEQLAQRIPCVLFNKSLHASNLPYAGADAFAAARLSVDLFHRHGRRRIAYVALNVHHSLYIEMGLGLENEMAARSMAIDKRLWFTRHTYLDGVENPDVLLWLDKLFAHDLIPDAMILGNDVAITHLQELLAGRGLHLGRDIDLVQPVSSSIPAAPHNRDWARLYWNYDACLPVACQMVMEAAENGSPVAAHGSVFRACPLLMLPGQSPQDAHKTTRAALVGTMHQR